MKVKLILIYYLIILTVHQLLVELMSKLILFVNQKMVEFYILKNNNNKYLYIFSIYLPVCLLFNLFGFVCGFFVVVVAVVYFCLIMLFHSSLETSFILICFNLK